MPFSAGLVGSLAQGGLSPQGQPARTALLESVVGGHGFCKPSLWIRAGTAQFLPNQFWRKENLATEKTKARYIAVQQEN
jgi:hypothetical protein